MAYRASRIEKDPLHYFLQRSGEGPFLRVADVVLRENRDPKEIFAHLISMGTGSKWSHSALVYLVSDPDMGYNDTFLIEARTRGVHLTSWRNEVMPFERFTVGIKRPRLDWYRETPYEISRHDATDPEDCPGIEYLRHVRGIAISQINGLFDMKTVYELSALYIERVAKRHLGAVPQIAKAADAVADFFKHWDAKETSTLRFICSGLMQYSYFEALRIRISNDIAIPEHREAAEHNLRNMHCVIFRDDPEKIIPRYIQQIQTGKLSIHDPAPDDVLDLLKTATPADFNNSPYLEWFYIILKGSLWCIQEVSEDYSPQSEEEQEVLNMLSAEHRP